MNGRATGRDACETLAVPADAQVAVPFLKWVGGKRQLLPQLRRYIPDHFGTYHEPFLGSAALFFDLWSRRRLGRVRLSDSNTALVGCYDVVRRAPGALIDALTHLEVGHRRLGSVHYYQARTRFNVTTGHWLASGTLAQAYPVDLAALFIYLNRTGFNGLYRLNARGDFNVPAGRYVNPRICDEGRLRAASAALQGPDVSLTQAPWQRVLDEARQGDLVYLDPPYAPLSKTANFTSYTAGGFGDDDQRLLADAVVALARRGCHVVLSNSTAPLIAELYEGDAAARAGLQAHRVPARRAINSHADGRGGVMEFIVATTAPQAGP